MFLFGVVGGVNLVGVLFVTREKGIDRASFSSALVFKLTIDALMLLFPDNGGLTTVSSFFKFSSVSSTFCRFPRAFWSLVSVDAGVFDCGLGSLFTRHALVELATLLPGLRVHGDWKERR